MNVLPDISRTLTNPDKLFIGGRWVDPCSSATIDVIDSATEELFFRVPEAREPDMDSAIHAARTAFDEGPWARLTHVERANYLRAFGDALSKKGDAMNELWPRESGVLAVIAPFGAQAAGAVFH